MIAALISGLFLFVALIMVIGLYFYWQFYKQSVKISTAFQIEPRDVVAFLVIGIITIIWAFAWVIAIMNPGYPQLAQYAQIIQDNIFKIAVVAIIAYLYGRAQ